MSRMLIVMATGLSSLGVYGAVIKLDAPARGASLSQGTFMFLVLGYFMHKERWHDR